MATYDLLIPQGARLWRAFQYHLDDVAQPLTGYEWRSQVRKKENPNSDLILDLTPYLALDGDDATRLLLDVPANVVAEVEVQMFKGESAWDLFLWPAGTPENAFVFLQGAASIDPSATDMRGL